MFENDPPKPYIYIRLPLIDYALFYRLRFGGISERKLQYIRGNSIMGCGPSKKRVEQQQYIQELNARARAKLDEAKQLLNEFSRDLDERHETRKRDARDAKATADALEKSASTLEEKVCAAVAARDADEQIARVARLDKAFAENNATSALRRKRLELQGLVPKNT